LVSGSSTPAIYICMCVCMCVCMNLGLRLLHSTSAIHTSCHEFVGHGACCSHLEAWCTSCAADSEEGGGGEGGRSDSAVNYNRGLCPFNLSQCSPPVQFGGGDWERRVAIQTAHNFSKVSAPVQLREEESLNRLYKRAWGVTWYMFAGCSVSFVLLNLCFRNSFA
jgi:hypothetical protein